MDKLPRWSRNRAGRSRRRRGARAEERSHSAGSCRSQSSRIKLSSAVDLRWCFRTDSTGRRWFGLRPDFELDAQTQASFPHLVCSWSPDGFYLAIPVPGRTPAIVIVNANAKSQLHLLDHATLPAWSPDGSKLAFIRCENGYQSLEVIGRRGQSFGSARQVVAPEGGHDPPPQAIGPVTARPFWSNDGRSILAVVERATSRSPELELARCVVNTTEVIRLLSLVPEPVRRTAVVRGVAIDFDREAERCFFSVELDGRDSDVAWSVPRNHETHKRFNPVDISQRVEALAVSPDGRLLAVRFGAPGGLSPPAVYDTDTEQTTLLVPDGTARSQWLSVLAGTAERLLLAGLPPAVADGRAAQRPTLLPLPGEIAAPRYGEPPTDPNRQIRVVGLLQSWRGPGRRGTSRRGFI